MLIGHDPGEYRVSRLASLSWALDGDFAYLSTDDPQDLDDAARREWARDELTKFIETEIKRLETDRLAIDTKRDTEDREEARDRALFDFESKEENLARKYEAATSRELFKTMKEFREIEAAAAEGRSVGRKTVETSEGCGALASSGRIEERPEANPPRERRRPGDSRRKRRRSRPCRWSLRPGIRPRGPSCRQPEGSSGSEGGKNGVAERKKGSICARKARFSTGNGGSCAPDFGAIRARQTGTVGLSRNPILVPKGRGVWVGSGRKAIPA